MSLFCPPQEFAKCAARILPQESHASAILGSYAPAPIPASAPAPAPALASSLLPDKACKAIRSHLKSATRKPLQVLQLRQHVRLKASPTPSPIPSPFVKQQFPYEFPRKIWPDRQQLVEHTPLVEPFRNLSPWPRISGGFVSAGDRTEAA